MLNPITTEKQYDEALDRVYDLMQMKLEMGSVKFNELGALAILVKEYEKEHYPISKLNSFC